MQVAHTFTLRIEKSFEGEFRAVLNSHETDIVTMPWLVGKDVAIKKFGQLLQTAHADIIYAAQNQAPVTLDTIKRLTNIR